MVTDLNYDGGPRSPVSRSILSRIKLGHVVMVMAGLFALVLNLAALRGNEATVEIVLAASDIRAGTTLTAGHLETGVVPADDLLTSRFVQSNQLADAIGKLATRPISAGEPILGEDLLMVENRSGLRAMSIPIEQSQAVAGRLARGDAVDIVLVENGVATYIATGIEVLEVPDSGTNALGARTGYAPTVAVDATQALRIAAALDAGEVHIVRSTGAALPNVQQAGALVESGEGESG